MPKKVVFKNISQEDFDNLEDKDENTFYKVYKGKTPISSYLGEIKLSPKDDIVPPEPVYTTTGYAVTTVPDDNDMQQLYFICLEEGEEIPSVNDTITVYVNDTPHTITIETLYTSLGGSSTTSDKWHTTTYQETTDKIYFCDGFENVDSITSCQNWFYQMSNVTEIVNLNKLNISNVTTMYRMFYHCSRLTSLDVSNFNTEKVTNMGRMFYSCNMLTTLDVSNFDTSKVTDMRYMFEYCSRLTTIYSDDDMFVTTAVTSGSDMFYQCTSLVGGNGTAYSGSHIDYTYAHIDTEDNPGYFTSIEDK